MDYAKLLEQVKRTPRVHGYISSYSETRTSPIHGLGLFANTSIQEGEVVAAWGGKVTTKDEIERLSDEIGYNYALELHPGFYLAERSIDELDSSDFINHSCKPNCKIVNQFIMITTRPVQAEEELTADFAIYSDQGEIACNCGAPNCKKVVHF